MKLNTLFVAAVCASTLLSSCVFKTAEENQLQYTHTSLVDGDAYAVIQKVNEVAIEGTRYAEFAEAAGESKDVAVKVKGFYAQFLPQLDSVATEFDVILNPVPVFVSPTADSTATESVAHAHEGYVQHAQHEIAVIKEQLNRLVNNTNPTLQKFAKDHLALANELYAAIGGKEEAHAHH